MTSMGAYPIFRQPHVVFFRNESHSFPSYLVAAEVQAVDLWWIRRQLGSNELNWPSSICAFFFNRKCVVVDVTLLPGAENQTATWKMEKPLIWVEWCDCRVRKVVWLDWLCTHIVLDWVIRTDVIRIGCYSSICEIDLCLIKGANCRACPGPCSESWWN